MSARVAIALLIAPACVLLAACGPSGFGAADYAPHNGGDARHGAALIGQFGCGACHRIPGVRGAVGVVAPPLDAFSQRSFIAGQVANTPANLERWIRNPQAIEPKTAMPALGLDDAQARDVAAYLLTLR